MGRRVGKCSRFKPTSLYLSPSGGTNGYPNTDWAETSRTAATSSATAPTASSGRLLSSAGVHISTSSERTFPAPVSRAYMASSFGICNCICEDTGARSPSRPTQRQPSTPGHCSGSRIRCMRK
eukprot:6198058-Pleurochrysis_carterae.AAC.2